MEFKDFSSTFISPDSMPNQQPYMLIGQVQNLLAQSTTISSYRNLSFDQPGTSSTSLSKPLSGGSGITIQQSSFRAPAHKHAHHLHSIPPREKSTRTLIIDHMLWVHARTRVSQARAELGMTDRTGGPSSPNYIHRRRPEQYEEEDELGSEGEDVTALKARAGGPGHPHNDDEDERQARQDLVLARSLRLRAEGLEKVITSMLDQPPPVHPVNDDDFHSPSSSPKVNTSKSTESLHLPNGVRLRLALGTIINDLFARQAPPPPYRHTHPPNSKAATPSEHSPPNPPSVYDLPESLASLAAISAAFTSPSPYPQISQPSRSAPYTNYNPSFPNSKTPSYDNQPSSSQIHYQPHPQSPVTPKHPHPSTRTRSLYALGADPTTANSPPSFRCPRHLHTGCEICVEAKSPQRPSGSSNSRGKSTTFTDRNNSGFNSWKAMPGGVAPGGGGITGWQDGSGIGSGLLRPGVRGSALRRKVPEAASISSSDKTNSSGAGNAKLSKLIPRFIRLSALVAAELGREARGEDGESDDGKDAPQQPSRSTSPRSPSVSLRSETVPTWSSPGNAGQGYSPMPEHGASEFSEGLTEEQIRMYKYAFRPTLEWYLLLAGLLTRAVLEGYLTAGWHGLHPVQCLLLVGLGINESVGRGNQDDADDDEPDDAEFSSLDPDELPSLVDATKILFPSLRNGGIYPKQKGEDEYESEMLERLKRFYDIPASTPDCSTHMEDLAWQYPAEPVERSAVRFCEAIARWRGKPELETYKKKPTNPLDASGSSNELPIESLVHSNPTSPAMANSNVPHGQPRRRLKKPSIDVYFMQNSSRRVGEGWGRGSANKRYRDVDDAGRPEPAKRTYQ